MFFKPMILNSILNAFSVSEFYGLFTTNLEILLSLRFKVPPPPLTLEIYFNFMQNIKGLGEKGRCEKPPNQSCSSM